MNSMIERPAHLKVRHVRRLSQIVNAFARQGFLSLLERVHVLSFLSPEQVRVAQKLDPGEDSSSEEDTLSIAVRLRQCLEELGPAFVKLGQILASRKDLLPHSFTDQFALLHNSVKPLPFEVVDSILKTELSGVYPEDFVSIDKVSLAAGSIGQIHLAKLKSNQQIVLKVQRPEIAPSIICDLELMELLAGGVVKYLPELKEIDMLSIVRQLKRALLAELDFVREGANTIRFKENFKNRDHIVIPEVYWDYSSSKVLGLQFLQGESISQYKNSSRDPGSSSQVLAKGLEMFLKMVFIDGLFHGDLHPGNLLVLEGDKIGVLDFGLTVRISRNIRLCLAKLMNSIMEEDFSTATRCFLELSVNASDVDFEAFEAEIANTVGPFLGLHLEKIAGTRVLWDLATLAAKHQAPLPSELTLFFKTLASFEGVGKELDPNFDILSSCRKFADELVKEISNKQDFKKDLILLGQDFSSLLKLSPIQIRQLMNSAIKGKLSFQIVSSDIEKIARSVHVASARLAVGIIIGALIIGSSILSHSNLKSDTYHLPSFGFFGFSLAGFLGLYIVWSIMRGRRF